MHDAPWDVVNMLWTAASGGVAGVVGAIKWFNKRFADYQTQLNEMREDLGEARKDIEVLKAHESNKTAHLAHIERILERLNDKQDEQTQLLIKLIQKGGH